MADVSGCGQGQGRLAQRRGVPLRAGHQRPGPEGIQEARQARDDHAEDGAGEAGQANILHPRADERGERGDRGHGRAQEVAHSGGRRKEGLYADHVRVSRVPVVRQGDRGHPCPVGPLLCGRGRHQEARRRLPERLRRGPEGEGQRGTEEVQAQEAAVDNGLPQRDRRVVPARPRGVRAAAVHHGRQAGHAPHT